MLTVIKKRLMRSRQQAIKHFNDDDIDDLPSFTPPASYIKLAQGKILLESRSLDHDVNSETTCANDKDDVLNTFPPSVKYIELAPGKIVLESSTPTEQSEPNDSTTTSRDKHQALLENRLVEVETTLQRLQERFNSHCATPRKELREQLENMSRVLSVKERKQTQACRDYKALQIRFSRQETILHAMQQENKALLLRIRQYEHCLDDVMRKVVDAIVAEDNLRLEVSMLKSRVRDLEAQNAALTASPAKGRDEGYCTMSSGQPQPSNGHLEDLPEEPEQWLLPAEPCSTEMEDWSMSQEELVLNNLDEERDQQQQMQQHQQNFLRQQQKHQLQQHKIKGQEDWIWNSQDFLNSTSVETDSVADGISQLLQQKIIYSEDEEVACTEFTDDFYKLVNIRSSSARSLYSYPEDATDDEDDDEDDLRAQQGVQIDDDDVDDEDEDDDNKSATERKIPTPTPSEAGRAQLTSCSSSETDDNSRSVQQEMQPSQILNSDKHDTKMEESQQPEDEPTYCVIAETTTTTPTPTESASSSNISTSSVVVANEAQRNARNLPKLGSSWRRSHGWRRVSHNTTVGALVSPKKETTTNGKFNYAQLVQKVPPTRIPTCITFPQQYQLHQQQSSTPVKIAHQPQQQQQQSTRKSKIPPPVPVRRSYSYAS